MHPVFEKLHPAIQRVLAKHNFTEPTEPQIKAIPAMFSRSSFLTSVRIPLRRYHFELASRFTDLLFIVMEIRIPRQ
jgi:hypothetical protein